MRKHSKKTFQSFSFNTKKISIFINLGQNKTRVLGVYLFLTVVYANPQFVMRIVKQVYKKWVLLQNRANILSVRCWKMIGEEVITKYRSRNISWTDQFLMHVVVEYAAINFDAKIMIIFVNFSQNFHSKGFFISIISEVRSIHGMLNSWRSLKFRTKDSWFWW